MSVIRRMESELDRRHDAIYKLESELAEWKEAYRKENLAHMGTLNKLAEARGLIDGCAEEINYLMQMGWIRFGEKAPQGAVKILAKIEEFRKR